MRSAFLLQQEITRQHFRSMQESAALGVYGMNRLLWYARIFRLSSSGLEDYKEPLCSLYETLTIEQKQTELGEEIALNLYPPRIAKEGDEMVDAELFDIDGNCYQLSDDNGKYRLLYFWSAGCLPSHQGIRSLAQRCEKYKEQLIIMGVHTEGTDIWEKFSREKEVPFINLCDGKTDKGIVLQYAVRGTPYYVIISPDNIVLKSQIDFQDGVLERALEEYIR